jgi:DNA-binding transcriptional ArsR family regulator
MGVTKELDYTQSQLLISMQLKALGHPARIAIVEHLLSVNSCICGDLVDQLELSQPTISRHLQELKSAGIIQGTISGNSVCYCLNTVAIAGLRNYFESMLPVLEAQNLCCK